MKLTQKILGIAAVLAAMSPLMAEAATANVPKYVNFQSVLRDDAGNLVEDGFIDMQFRILDQDQDVVYEETQPGVQVVRSAINVMIGEGVKPGSSPSTPTGGIPVTDLDPEKGTHFLQVQFGSNQPSDPMELGSVPYAMYANVALSLPSDFSDDAIPTNFATDSEVAAAIAAHEAKNIAVAHPNGDFPANRIVGEIVTGQIANDAVTGPKIADDAVSSSTIQDGSIVPADLDSTSFVGWDMDESNDFLKDGSRAMTGELQVPDQSAGSILSGTNFNVGRTLRRHEERLTALEGVPPAALAKAWVKFHTDGSHNRTIDGAYNVSDVVYSGSDDGGWKVIFLTPFADTNYVMGGSGGGGPGSAMMLSCDSATSTNSTAFVVGTDKNGNSQTGNARTYNLVFFGN